jgi:hypothetical protein
MNSFVPNLHEKFGSLVVLFTHDATVRKLKVELVKQKQASGAGSELGNFLDHLLKYVTANDDRVIVEPTVAAKREAILEVIKAATPLATDSESFRFVLPTESRMLFVCYLYDCGRGSRELLYPVYALIIYRLRGYEACCLQFSKDYALIHGIVLSNRWRTSTYYTLKYR